MHYFSAERYWREADKKTDTQDAGREDRQQTKVKTYAEGYRWNKTKVRDNFSESSRRYITGDDRDETLETQTTGGITHLSVSLSHLSHSLSCP